MYDRRHVWSRNIGLGRVVWLTSYSVQQLGHLFSCDGNQRAVHSNHVSSRQQRFHFKKHLKGHTYLHTYLSMGPPLRISSQPGRVARHQHTHTHTHLLHSNRLETHGCFFHLQPALKGTPTTSKQPQSIPEASALGGSIEPEFTRRPRAVCHPAAVDHGRRGCGSLRSHLQPSAEPRAFF